MKKIDRKRERKKRKKEGKKERGRNEGRKERKKERKKIITKTRLLNILKILPPKNENFQKKKNDIFYISAQNIGCGYSLEPPRRGGSNEYPQSMFCTGIRKIMYTPVNPSFTI